MNGKTFVDTNVLIYAHDVDAKGKHHAARAILAELWSERSGVVSMQVLQEFYVNATRKIAHPLPKESGRLVVSTYAVWCVDTPRAGMSTGLRIEDESPIGFWDGLIIASALKSGATRIRSGALNGGPMIPGI